MASKISLPFFCYKNKFPTPATVHVANINDVPFYANQFNYPIVVKGTIASAKVVNNWSDALYYAKIFNSKWGGGVLLQEKIEGEEFDVSAVVRQDETPSSLLPMKKLGISAKRKESLELH